MKIMEEKESIRKAVGERETEQTLNGEDHRLLLNSRRSGQSEVIFVTADTKNIWAIRPVTLFLIVEIC
jgi:hypothetical protein